jgi:hypothetical protein
MVCTNPLTEQSKWYISGISSLIFLVIASPFMFELTGQFFDILGIETEVNGNPNWLGLLIHSILFGIVIRLSMFIPIPSRT